MFLKVTERWVERLVLAITVVAVSATVSHGQSQGQVFERQRVLLVPMQGQEGVSPVVPTKVFEYLRTLMELNGEVSFFVPQTLTEPAREEMPEVAETDPVLTRADDYLWRAKERAAAGNYLQATNSFKQAVIYYQKGMDNLENYDKVVDARLGIALAFYYAGDKKEGRKALRQVVEVRPDVVLDKRKVPEQALEDLEAIKSKIAGTPARPVKVVSDPPGAHIYVDGNRKGVAPLSLQGLTVGRHVLRAVMDGHQSKSRAFTTDGAKKKTLKIRLASKKGGSGDDDTLAKLTPELVERLLGSIVQKGDFSSKSFKKLLAQLKSRYDLNGIVLTYVRGNGDDYDVATFLYETSTGRLAEMEWFSLDRELTNMQAKLLVIEEQVQAGLAAFPESRELKGQSKIFVNINAIRARKEAIAKKRAEVKRRREEKLRKREEGKARKAEAKQVRLEAKKRARKEAKARKANKKRAKAEAKRLAREEQLRTRKEALRTRKEAKVRAADAARARQESARSRKSAERAARSERDRRSRDRKTQQESARRSRDDARRFDREERSRLAREERARQQQSDRAREEADDYAREQRKEQRRRELEEERYNRQQARESEERDALRRRARDAEQEAASLEKWGSVSEEETYDNEEDYAEEEDAGLVGDLANSDSWSVDDDEEPRLGTYDTPVSKPVRPSAYDSSAYDPREDDVRESIVVPDHGLVRQQGARASRPWYQQWWVWTAAGVVLAGATAGAVMSMSSGPEDPGFRATVTW